MPRRKEFDPDEALIKAMHYFWTHGFKNTSIRDLISGTGVNFYGLYSVFGDKRGIYLRGLDKYISIYLKKLKSCAADASSFHEAISNVFDCVLEIVTAENNMSGCMVCNAAVEVAPQDEEVAGKILHHRKVLESFFIELMEQFDISEVRGTSEMDRAEFLTSQIYCMGFLVRSQVNDDVLKNHIQTSLKLMA